MQDAILVDELFSSKPWTEIAFPLLQESIASVSGRFTSGRFHKGSLTNHAKNLSLEQLSGYQMALEDFYNRLYSFLEARDKLKADKKQEKSDKEAPIYNPFLEEGKE